MVEIQINLDHYSSEFVKATNGHLAAMRTSLRALTDGVFNEHGDVQSQETVQLRLTINPEAIEQKIVSDAFLAIQRSFVEWEVRVLGVARLKNQGSILDQDVESLEALDAFVRDQLDLITLEISHDHELNSPKKIEELTTNLPEIKKILLDYNTLRNNVEHNLSISSKNVDLKYRTIQMTVDGVPTMLQSGMTLHEGQVIGIKVNDIERGIKVGEKITFAADEIEGVVVWLQTLAVPQITQSLLMNP